MHHDVLREKLEKLHEDSFGWALHCCAHDTEMAKEVLQSAYLKVLRNNSRFLGKSNFNTWFFAIIRNTAVDHFRKTKKLKFYSQDDMKDMELKDGTNPEQELDQNYWEHYFDEAIQSLSKRQGEIMHLVFYQNLSIQEAADILNISIGSARKHYHRAKKTLSEWIKKGNH